MNIVIKTANAMNCIEGTQKVIAAGYSRSCLRQRATYHVVTPAQTSTTTDQAPPFPVIAKIPAFDAAKIAPFLLEPHPKMPDMGLSRKETADLAACIATLK
jgi:hypothetical protein